VFSVAARIAKCSRDTVLRWIEEGAIEARRSLRCHADGGTSSAAPLERYLIRRAQP